jgi:hypothetical protein
MIALQRSLEDIDPIGLRALFAPRSVAVIGASQREGSIGRAILSNLTRHGFAGTPHAPLPTASQIAERVIESGELIINRRLVEPRRAWRLSSCRHLAVWQRRARAARRPGPHG